MSETSPPDSALPVPHEGSAMVWRVFLVRQAGVYDLEQRLVGRKRHAPHMALIPSAGMMACSPS